MHITTHTDPRVCPKVKRTLFPLSFSFNIFHFPFLFPLSVCSHVHLATLLQLMLIAFGHNWTTWTGLGWATVAVASSVAEGLFQVCRIFKYVLSDTPQFGAILFDVSVGAQCDALVHFAKDLRKQHTRVLSIPSVCGYLSIIAWVSRFTKTYFHFLSGLKRSWDSSRCFPFGNCTVRRRYTISPAMSNKLIL